MANDTHIVGLMSNVLPIFLLLQEEFGALGLSMQLTKCVVWFPQKLYQLISLPPGFLAFKFVF